MCVVLCEEYWFLRGTCDKVLDWQGLCASIMLARQQNPLFFNNQAQKSSNFLG